MGSQGEGYDGDAGVRGELIRSSSREELMRSAAEEDGFTFRRRRARFPTPGSRAERRRSRQVAGAFLLTFLASVGFMVVYLVVPWRFNLHRPSDYEFFTPLLGVCLGVALLSLSFGLVWWAKTLMPDEEVVEERTPLASDDEEYEATQATLVQAVDDTGLPRRSMIRRALGLAAAGLGVLAVFPLGGLVVNPRSTLSRTLWKKGVRMVTDDGRLVRPGDLQPGSMATVFPGVPGGRDAGDSPVMLIRLRPGQRVSARPGQAHYGWGDFIAFSKICTHAGCPVSLYEQQTNRLLCPCHQSQFRVLEDARPIFGPAVRPLPQLPITVDRDGYFTAVSDFQEPVGPAFWERRNDYVK